MADEKRKSQLRPANVRTFDVEGRSVRLIEQAADGNRVYGDPT